ncbi:MAG: hypothetical protein GY847_01430 [Proteobacteria bacterium]|nr:hypothetical protein [Pseudomonadota bacterium]
MPKKTSPKDQDNMPAFLAAIGSGLPSSVTAMNGEEISLGKITWRKRIAAMAIVSEVYDSIWGGAKSADYTMVEAMRTLLTDCPNHLTSLVEIATGKDRDFIMDQFDDDSILKVALPFFGESISTRDKMMLTLMPEMALSQKAQEMATTNGTEESG